MEWKVTEGKKEEKERQKQGKEDKELKKYEILINFQTVCLTFPRDHNARKNETNKETKQSREVSWKSTWEGETRGEREKREEEERGGGGGGACGSRQREPLNGKEEFEEDGGEVELVEIVG